MRKLTLHTKHILIFVVLTGIVIGYGYAVHSPNVSPPVPADIQAESIQKLTSLSNVSSPMAKTPGNPVQGGTAGLEGALGDSTIVKRIRSEIKDYESLDDIKRVQSIREWVYCNADIASSRDYLINQNKYPLHSQTLSENFKLLFENIGGHWCAGTAFLLMQAYKALGYPSWVLHYGDHKTLTHAITLVEVGGVIYVQDGYFNLTFIDNKKKVMTFYGLLRRLSHGKTADIREGTKSLKKDVHFKAAPLPSSWTLVHADPKSAKKVADGHFVYKGRPSLQDFLDRHSLILRVYDFLEGKGLPRNLQFLMLFPYAVYDKHYITDPAKSEILSRALNVAPWLHEN